MTVKTAIVDYAVRDEKGESVFYVLLWKRKGIKAETFSDYWRNVHGPVCGRLPGQYQYWQFHLESQPNNLWPTKAEINYHCEAEDRFDGIAELTFTSDRERQNWFESASVLMNDEYNIFSKAVGYTTSLSQSKTYLDRIEQGEPNGKLNLLKFHVLLKKSSAVTVKAFQRYLTDTFAPAIVESESVLKFRLHLLETVDNSRPDANGVIHSEPPEKQYQAAFEIAFSNPLEMNKFFTSPEYAQATANQAQYVSQINPFSEQSVYTFVYNGHMTLAGQRGSTAAELITEVGATNQLKEDITALIAGTSNGHNGLKPTLANLPSVNGNGNGHKKKANLGNFLQGVQHIGITVDDMTKAVEFYTEVLGGKVALSGDGFYGSVLQNTLFQKENIDAIQLGIDPKILGVPNLRDNSQEALDVKFISFGNVCVELIHFRDAALGVEAPGFTGRIPSGIGRTNSPHISFHVKDDIDLNLFAKTLEEECQGRGLTNVVCNRIIEVKSEAERREVALKYNANKFWHDPKYFVEGYSDTEFGDFYGWSLFYCKGPNGEQLEFNQVTRNAKHLFSEAQKQYNAANGTNFSWTSDAIGHRVRRVPGEMSQIVREMFLAGESMNVENFVKFYTDDALYQFSKFPLAYGPQGIRDSSVEFLQKVKAVKHHIINMWENGNTVVCEMEVTYTRYDGQVFTLPCLDFIQLRDHLVESIQIFMDISPVLESPETKIPKAALNELRSSINGSLHTSEDEGYDKARTTWNLSIDQNPSLVATVTSSSDTLSVVNFARTHNLNIGIQSTGHGVIAPCNGGLLINTSRMQGIKIDPITQTALVGAGALWGDVIQAAQEFGLAPLSGFAPNVGVVGYTLGGGIGWLVRKYGAACDSLKSVELITADGQLLKVSKTNNRDLFWGIRGGGSTFGVITSIEFNLYPVTNIYGGQLFYPVEMADEIFDLYRQWVETIPDELTSAIALMHIPPLPEIPTNLRGKLLVVLSVCLIGSEKEGEKLLKPFYDLREPIAKHLTIMPYSNVGSIHADPIKPQRHYGYAGLLPELSSDVIKQLITLAGADSSSPLHMVEIRHLGGAMKRGSKQESALIDRNAPFLLQVQSILITPEQTKQVEEYTDLFAQTMLPYETGNIFPNFQSDYRDNDPRTRNISSADNAYRLSKLKEKYDPENLFL